MVILDFVVDQPLRKAELSFVTTISGGLFVMMFGQLQMLWWSADNSDIQHQVYGYLLYLNTHSLTL